MPFARQPGQLRRLGALCLLAATACTASREESGGEPPAGDAPPSPASPLITTDRESYRVRRTANAIETDIVTTFTNRTSDTVRLHPCGSSSQPSFMLEKWTDGAWKAAYSQPCPAILMLDPPKVAPGASRTDTARVRAMLAANAMPRFETEPVGGSYRVVYAQAYRSWRSNEGPGELLPLEQRVSNTFRIEE
jgi:hypothetical protein